MTLFLSMLPLYLLGNLHCLGMCGPIVAALGQHRYRNYYFLGRFLSFSLAGLFAGATGALMYDVFKLFDIPVYASLLLGSLMIVLGFIKLFSLAKYIPLPFQNYLGYLSHYLSKILLKDRKETTFIFGFCTIFLPCGQTVIVFCGCALAQDALVGLFNGALFALLTTPALFLSMQARCLFKNVLNKYDIFMGMSALLVGFLAIFRGLADKGVVSHLVLIKKYHIVLF